MSGSTVLATSLLATTFILAFAGVIMAVLTDQILVMPLMLIFGALLAIFSVLNQILAVFEKSQSREADQSGAEISPTQ